jgi:hypothetical protein
MKKIIRMAVLGGLLACMAACDSSAPSNQDAAATATATADAGRATGKVLLDLNLQTQKLPTMAGVGQFVDGKGLVSTGMAGTLMFGPYSAMAAGKYKVTVTGSFDGTQPAKPLTLDVAYSKGSTVPKSVDVAPADVAKDGTLASFEFTLPTDVSDLEVRATVADGTHVLIKGYQVVVE